MTVQPDPIEKMLQKHFPGTLLRQELIARGHDVRLNASRPACILTYRLNEKGILDWALAYSHKKYNCNRIDGIVKRDYQTQRRHILQQECYSAGLRTDGSNWDLAIRLYCRDMGVEGFERAEQALVDHYVNNESDNDTVSDCHNDSENDCDEDDECPCQLHMFFCFLALQLLKSLHYLILAIMFAILVLVGDHIVECLTAFIAWLLTEYAPEMVKEWGMACWISLVSLWSCVPSWISGTLSVLVRTAHNCLAYGVQGKNRALMWCCKRVCKMVCGMLQD